MSPKTKSSRALRAVVLGVALEEGTRLARKYGPALLDRITEQAIDKGPGLVAEGWQKAKTAVLRRTHDTGQEGTEAAPPRVSEDGDHEGQELVQG
jgi:hypothetical protein